MRTLLPTTTHQRVVLAATVVTILGMIALLCVPATVLANGSPHRVVLSYMADVSNWGPQGAVGVAELAMTEGEVRLTAVGLPRLNGEVYVAWLVINRSNRSLALGQFNADEKGEARLQQTLPQAIPNEKWDLLVITVEKAGSDIRAPGSRRAIAGYFADRTQMALPQQLPRTGNESTPPESSLSVQPVWPLAASAVFGGLIVVALQRVLKSRRGKNTSQRKEVD